MTFSHKHFARFASIVTASGWLAGCAVPNPYVAPGAQPQAPVPEQSGVTTQPAATPESAVPAQPLPPTAPRPRTAMGPATRALVAQAQSQLTTGNGTLAAATLERALRIEPDNPLLWIELAKVRQQEGNPAQAENLARKALSMAGGDAKTQAAAWRVIAQSLRARGRNPEARDADAKAEALGG